MNLIFLSTNEHEPEGSTQSNLLEPVQNNNIRTSDLAQTKISRVLN